MTNFLYMRVRKNSWHKSKQPREKQNLLNRNIWDRRKTLFRMKVQLMETWAQKVLFKEKALHSNTSKMTGIVKAEQLTIADSSLRLSKTL